jgi:hypothetical protein
MQAAARLENAEATRKRIGDVAAMETAGGRFVAEILGRFAGD